MAFELFPLADAAPVHAYEYGVVPPPADTTAKPLVPPLQVTVPVEEILAVNNVGSVIITWATAVQLFWSVAVMVYVPAHKLVAVWALIGLGPPTHA